MYGLTPSPPVPIDHMAPFGTGVGVSVGGMDGSGAGCAAMTSAPAAITSATAAPTSAATAIQRGELTA